MELFKKSERTVKTYEMINSVKAVGATAKPLGEYCKWKELSIGGKLQVKMTIYKITFNGQDGYFLSDSLDRVACRTVLDKQEVIDWLKEHGYKRDKQWYMEDYGMSESDWNYWNGLEER